MASFDYTVDLERALLHAFTTSIMMARMYIHRVKEDMFTSNERKFIYNLATQTLNDAKTLLSHTVLEYEVQSKVADSDQTYYISEWNIIAEIVDTEPPESLIKKLSDAIVGRKAMSLAEDVVGHLASGNIEEAVRHLKREAMMIGLGHESRPLVELTDYQHRLQTIRDKQAHPEKYLGIKIGLPTFDNHTGGLFKGELTLIAGITGLGKSTLCKAIEYGISTLNTNKNVLHIANEEYLEQVENKFDALTTGVPYLDFKLARISEENLQLWEKVMTDDMKKPGRGRIFIKEVPAFTDVTLIEQAFRELENKGIHIDVIIIDHLPHIKPIQQAWGENDERGKAASDCKELARCLQCAVVVPTQAATEVEEKSSKGKRAGKLDVYGSKAQIHVSNTFIIITSKGTDEKQTSIPEYQRDVYWLVDIKKNRDGSPFWFKAKHWVKFGKVEEVPDDGKGDSVAAGAEEKKAMEEAIGDATTKPTVSTSVVPKTLEVANNTEPLPPGMAGMISNVIGDQQPVVSNMATATASSGSKFSSRFVKKVG